jgi:hypothetical protein
MKAVILGTSSNRGIFGMIKRYRRSAGWCGSLVRNLDHNGFWKEVIFSPRIGYYLSGNYGRLKKLSKQEGRLYMRGLAVPIYREPDPEPGINDYSYF